MYIKARSIVLFCIGIVFFATLGGGKYFLANRFQELGILFSLILFFFAAFLAALNVRDKDLNWSFWFFSPIVFVCYTMVLPAYIFSSNNGVAMLPSVAACREFLAVFIAPALYFLYRLGLTVKEIERAFVTTLVVLAISYLVHYFRMNLEAAYFSPDHSVSSLVTFDPWRGYRLRPPTVAMFIITLVAPIKLFYARSPLAKLAWGAFICILAYIWFINSQRTASASLLASVMIYHFMFAKKARIGLFFAALPVIIAVTTVGIRMLFQHLSTLDPEFDGVRYKSYTIAWEVIKQNPIFGFGQQSYSTKTEQDLLWWKFHSSDLGMIGVTFKYGFSGAILYVLISYLIMSRTLSTIWRYRKKFGESNALLFALFVFYISTTIVFILQTKYIFMPGLSMVCLGLALTSIYKHRFKTLESSRT